MVFVFFLCLLSSKFSQATRDLSFAYVAQYPRDAKLYTQGLIYIGNGKIIDSNGLYGHSNLRVTDLTTGHAYMEYKLPVNIFAEGVTRWGDKLYQLTWRARKVFVYNADTLELLSTLELPSGIFEGWGITHNSDQLIISDGSSWIHFVDPELFSLVSSIQVKDSQGNTINNLNELEYIHGYIWANEYLTNNIHVIDPATGISIGILNLKSLVSYINRNHEVTNGIAYIEKNGHLLVTGKKWNTIFEIQIIDMPKKYISTSSCVDNLLWSSKNGMTCSDYEISEWCNMDGSNGPNWQSYWGILSDWARNGIDATQACCVCGGGRKK